MPWRRGYKLKLVREAEARGRVQETYQDIKQALGVPQVSAMFQAFALYPTFLELFWCAMRPATTTQQFFRLGDRIRAEAYTRVHNYFSVPDLCSATRNLSLSPGAQQEITEVVDLFHYFDPLQLLMAAVQLRAYGAPAGQVPVRAAPAQHPVFQRRTLTVEEETAPPGIKAVYDDMKHSLAVPALSASYLAFARFPAFLESYWNVLKPISQSALYSQSGAGVRETAWSLVEEFPARVELTTVNLSDAGMSDDDITGVVRITEMFVNELSRLVLNLAIAKIGLEGGTRPAAPSTTPAEGEPKQAA